MVSRSMPSGEPWVDNLSQRRRRVIVALTLAALPMLLAWWWWCSVNSASGGLWFLIVVILLGQAVGGSLVLLAHWSRANRPDRLDERQRQLRDRAWVLSYRVTVIAIAVAVEGALAVPVFGLGRPITLDAGFAYPWGLASIVIFAVLPAAALAWIEPDPPAEI